MINTNLIGNIGEIKAMEYFTIKGYEIYMPFGTATSVDMVVVKDNKSYRVSVKSGYSKISNTSYNIKIQQRNRKGAKSFDIKTSDFLFIYIIPEDKYILLKSKDIKQNTAISIKIKNLNIIDKLNTKSIINIKPKQNNCKCGNTKTIKAKMCRKCAGKKNRKIKNRPSKETLIKELETFNYVQVSKKYGVSDNTIRKWLK